MKTLFFFTTSYPYGFNEIWKETELKQFAKDFDEITVIPFHNPKNNAPREVPANTIVSQPAITDYSNFRKDVFKLMGSRHLFYYLKEFFNRRVFMKKPWFWTWFVSSVWTELLRRHPVIDKLLRDPDYGKDSVLYFFWGRGSAFIIPLLDRKKFRKVVVRFHGYDLYEERKMNKGYIPFRVPILRNITDAAFISRHGMEYIDRKYPAHAFKSHLFRLGSLTKGQAKPSDDGIFRIYTCSSMTPVKRLPLLAAALVHSEVKLEWHHIGNGKERDNILSAVSLFPSHVRFIEHGSIRPDQVLEKYNGAMVDLFMNVSESEGVPVSIMEAISAGIPVLATDVGGTSEIVKPELGVLLEKDITPRGIWNAIMNYITLSQNRKSEMRIAARTHYLQHWDAIGNTEQTSAFLVG